MRRSLALLAGLAALAAGCGGDDEPEETRFEQEDAPFAFAYPPELTPVEPRLAQTEGRPPVFTVSLGIDEANYVNVASYHMKVPLDLGDPSHQREVDRAAQALAKSTAWDLGARQEGKLGPLPAYTYPLEKIDTGREGRLVYAFSGADQYFVRCEWEYDIAPAIPPACDQVQRTFEPLGAAAGGGEAE